MKVKNEAGKRARVLAFAVCAALALEFAGCKGGAGGSATSEPGAAAAGSETNSAATNASTANTNASTSQ